jgi:hypothetical protein
MPLVRSFSEAKVQVEQLVERFDRNRDVCTRSDFKETQARVEFIDPLFEALGRDVRNTQGYAEQCRNVVTKTPPLLAKNTSQLILIRTIEW